MKVDRTVPKGSLRDKKYKNCHSERGTSEESLKTNAPVQPDSSSQAPQNDMYNHFLRSPQDFYKKFCDPASE